MNSSEFHPRIINKTNIVFSEQEIALLNKGLKYNLNYKQKNWNIKLALEAETTITQLRISEQEYMRYRVEENINKLYTQYDHNKHYSSIHDKKEKKILNRIKEKLEEDSAIIPKADEG